MAENINKTRLLKILQELAQGHYDQEQKIKAFQQAGLDTNAINALIDAKLETLIGGAPEALNTLKEIADKLAEDETAVSAILAKVTALQAKDNDFEGRIAAVEAYNARITTLESKDDFDIPDSWLADIQNRMANGATV